MMMVMIVMHVHEMSRWYDDCDDDDDLWLMDECATIEFFIYIYIYIYIVSSSFL